MLTDGRGPKKFWTERPYVFGAVPVTYSQLAPVPLSSIENPGKTVPSDFPKVAEPPEEC